MVGKTFPGTAETDGTQIVMKPDKREVEQTAFLSDHKSSTPYSLCGSFAYYANKVLDMH